MLCGEDFVCRPAGSWTPAWPLRLRRGGASDPSHRHPHLPHPRHLAPGTWHYTWDAHDRLVETRTPDGTRWTYTYDSFGRRVAKHRHHTDGRIAETVRFTWHDTTFIEEHHTAHDGAGTDTVTTWDHTGHTTSLATTLWGHPPAPPPHPGRPPRTRSLSGGVDR
ncbi:RHS repeat protein [Streptomyces sp. ST2-7A]|nr:RHS repeat protein [Streptomyces sp. ST2-7A]